MKESRFQYTNPSLVEFIFSPNDGYVADGDKCDVPLSFNVKISEKEDTSAVVDLIFELGLDKDQKYPYYIRCIERARFRWEEGMNDEMIDAMLNKNAPALLLSYIRPIISVITAASPYPSVNIPFFDFTAHGE